MLLKDICVLDVACCSRETTVLAAARLMRQYHTGDLIVVDDPDQDRVPAGILTDRDIVVEVLGNGRDPAHTAVSEVMSSKLVIADSYEEITTAVERMRTHGVRRLPVVQKGSVFGIVTLDDLLRLHVEESMALLQIIINERTHESRSRRL